MGSRTNIELAFVGAKGGVGVTTSTLIAARRSVTQGRSVVLVDLTGDQGVALGVSPDLPGMAEAVRAPERFDVRSALVEVAPGIRMVPRGTGRFDPDDTEAWKQVWGAIEEMRDVDVLIDAGRGEPALELVQHSAAGKVLVLNCCYQALHRARDVVGDVNAVLVQSDTQRALGVADIEAALGCHSDAVLPVTRSVARWMDAGLILDRDNKEAKGIDGVYAAFEVQHADSVGVQGR